MYKNLVAAKRGFYLFLGLFGLTLLSALAWAEPLKVA